MVLGATSYMPLVPPRRVGIGFRSISCLVQGAFKVTCQCLFWPFYSHHAGVVSSHSIHKAQRAGSRHIEGWYMGCKVTILQLNRVGSWTWPCGFAKCLGLVPKYVVSVVGNEGGVLLIISNVIIQGA